MAERAPLGDVPMEGHERQGGENADLFPPAKRVRVSLDPLQTARVQRVDEKGVEELVNTLPADQKLLALLNCIDLQPKAKRAKALDDKTKENEEGDEKAGALPTPPSEWPWKTAIEELISCQHELRVMLDIIASVEAGESVAVTSIARAKVAPAEMAGTLALQCSVKQQACEVGCFQIEGWLK
eukprot:TRINITY_DN11010_c0_g1_i1.p1 TRINITY_DN11010_c0_g1~~TRINITY_DN11010_c0_g1_i1.p1  ORF type:complete len:183 (+),score=42.49 TRINITY_DN11010_c0_g1_i1:337-885(+)